MLDLLCQRKGQRETTKASLRISSRKLRRGEDTKSCARSGCVAACYCSLLLFRQRKKFLTENSMPDAGELLAFQPKSPFQMRLMKFFLWWREVNEKRQLRDACRGFVFDWIDFCWFLFFVFKIKKFNTKVNVKDLKAAQFSFLISLGFSSVSLWLMSCVMCPFALPFWIFPFAAFKAFAALPFFV